MYRGIVKLWLASALIAPLATIACSSGDAKEKDRPTAPPTVAVAPAAAVEQPIARFIRPSERPLGRFVRPSDTLMAEEQAAVAAETAGRVVSAQVERGTPVAAGAE